MKRIEDLRILIDRIPYAEGNIGEEAILASLLQDLQACGVKDISVSSNQPERTRARHGDVITVIPDCPATWLNWPFKIRQYDLLIWGGGHMLQDRSSQLYIPYVSKILSLARIAGVPRFIYAPGLGPILKTPGKLCSRFAISGSKYVVVRDQGSLDLLQQIGVPPPIHRTADPAFSLSTVHDKIDFTRAESGPIIGFAPRKLFYRKGSWLPVSMQRTTAASVNEPFEKFLTETAVALDLLIEQEDAHVRLFAMDIGPNPRDDKVCNQIVGRMVNQNRVVVYDNDPSLSEFVRRLGELDLLVSARLHGIILGYRFGLPWIGIDSDGKIPRLAKMTEMDDFIIKDSEFERGNFFELAVRAIKEQQGIRAKLKKFNATLRATASKNRQYLEQALQELISRK